MLTGRVVDDASGEGLAHAEVTVAGTKLRAVTDAAGRYELPIPGKSHTLALSIVAAGHAPHRRYMQAPIGNYGHLETRLRAFETQQAVQLPEAGADAVMVRLRHGTATMNLRIEAGDMVRQDGAPARGPVQVNVAFWHPLESLASAPGLMMAGDANMQRLKSWGMADMEVRQDDALLQVATGQTLEWTVQLPQDFGAAYSALPPRLQPNLYYLDPNDGLWRKDGVLSVDANTALFTATLPHLSAWNLDSLNAADGGCVRGRVLNKCGRPAAHRPISLWFLGDMELKDFPLTTDASGAYCVNVGINPLSTITSGTSNKDTTTHYRVSGTNMQDTTQCNPLPSECMTCNAEPLECNGCAYGITYNAPDPAPSCVPPLVAITACNWCPGTCPDPSVMFLCGQSQGGPGCLTECETLQDVVVSDPSCDNSRDPNSARNPNGPSACSAGAKAVGAQCDTGSPCCNVNLVCADFVCVPPND